MQVKSEPMRESDDDLIANINYAGNGIQKRFPRAFRRQSRQQFAPGRGRNQFNQKPTRPYPYSGGRGSSGSGTGSTSHIRCYTCHKLGHVARNCNQQNMFSIYNSDGKVQNIFE